MNAFLGVNIGRRKIRDAISCGEESATRRSERRTRFMIIDCDSHFMPRDAFAHVTESLRALAPQLRFDESGFLSDITFPGAPPSVSGSTPLPAPGSGSGYAGNTDMDVRLREYDKMG